MSEKLEVRRRMTLRQFAAELQQSAIQAKNQLVDKAEPEAPENTIACKIATGLAKGRRF
jgi:hypothetical protein